MFDAMRAAYTLEQKKKDDEIARKAAAEDAANEERQKRLKEMSKKKREMMMKLDLNQPLVQIPDCKEKYYMIIEDLKNSGGGKFTDE